MPGGWLMSHGVFIASGNDLAVSLNIILALADLHHKHLSRDFFSLIVFIYYFFLIKERVDFEFEVLFSNSLTFKNIGLIYVAVHLT